MAIIYGDRQLTYRALNGRANQLAHYLRECGVGPEVPVAIYMERSVEMIVGLFAVLKSGGAYVPLDPNYPIERLAFMLQDTHAPVLLTQQRLVEDRRASDPRFSIPFLSEHERLNSQSIVICVDSDWKNLIHNNTENPQNGAAADNLAYVIYTSGSTGNPKGVMVTHGSLLNAYLAWEEIYQLRHATTTHLQMASFSFDVFSGDCMRALCSGKKLVLCPTEFLLDAPALYRLMLREGVDCAEFIPAVMRNLCQYLEENKRSLEFMHILVVGSETWYVEEFQKIHSLCGPNTQVINSYGLTEATIDSSYFRGRLQGSFPDRSVPIGRPFPNTHLYVLDGYLQPVPVGVPGELHIGGAGLARGYLNRPDLTAKNFIPNPFSENPGEYLYKTGDLVRYLPDGNIELIGRLDNQVKIRGFRIELGEIEAVLGTHPAVREALVTTWEVSPGDKRLAAYVVPKQRSSATPSELLSFLGDKLPYYMVPSSFIFLERLPLTANGKVDRGALPGPEGNGSELEETFVLPRTPIEETLTGIWAELLRLKRVSIDDNFFRLGGHSLLATQLTSRLRDAFHIDLPVRALFENPTVATLATQIANICSSEGGPTRLEQILADLESVSDEEAQTLLANEIQDD